MSAAYALSEFGASLGLGPLVLPAQGVLNMELAPGQTLSLESSGQELLMYTTLHVPHLDSARLLALLQSCDVRRRPPHEPCLQAGLRGEGADSQLSLLVRWPLEALQVSQLAQTMALFEQCKRQELGLAH